jgi:hypothetical protein
VEATSDAALAGFQLECAPSLAIPITWQTITNGITADGGLYHIVPVLTSAAPFRLAITLE